MYFVRSSLFSEMKVNFPFFNKPARQTLSCLYDARSWELSMIAYLLEFWMKKAATLAASYNADA